MIAATQTAVLSIINRYGQRDATMAPGTIGGFVSPARCRAFRL
jgi:hypothetical protein